MEGERSEHHTVVSVTLLVQVRTEEDFCGSNIYLRTEENTSTLSLLYSTLTHVRGVFTRYV